MEKPLIAIVHENDALAKMQAGLPSLGFRVHAFSTPSDFISSREKFSSDAIILDRRSAEAMTLSALPNSNTRPVIMVSEADNAKISDRIPENFIELPNDLLVLFRFLQENLTMFRRRHLRLNISLPGIYCHGEGCHVAEIMSLGTGGAFIKTGWHHLERDDLIKIGIPLLGMSRELEIEGHVVYHIEPNEGNNYLQGVGIRFTRPETETVRIVEEYIRYFLQEELFESPYAGGGIPASNFVRPRLNHFAGDGRLTLKV